MLTAENAIGKPFVVLIDGQRRQIGLITDAAVKNGKLFVACDLDLSEDRDEIEKVMEDA
jgi:hypothetical protein